MNKLPSITLSGRKRFDEDRLLYLFEYQSNNDNIVFEYRFSDWAEDSTGYFVLFQDSIFFNKDLPKLETDNKVANYYRPHAYSNDEIRAAIENYLIEKIILVEG